MKDRELITLMKGVIAKHQLYDWFAYFPWLTGSLGDAMSPVWFIGENPSLGRVQSVHRHSVMKSEDLQWSYNLRECRLFRDAISDAGLKTGAPEINDGWRCYITNAIKEPRFVGDANKNRTTSLMDDIKRWLPVLQYQIDTGRPKVLVALGSKVETILRHMERVGLKCPHIEKIMHYSYVMLRPEAGTRRGPGHPERQKEFKRSISEMAGRYNF